MECKYSVVARKAEFKSQLLASNYDPEFLPDLPKCIKYVFDDICSESGFGRDFTFQVNEDYKLSKFIEGVFYEVKTSFISQINFISIPFKFVFEKCGMTYEELYKFVNDLGGIHLLNTDSKGRVFEFMKRITDLTNTDWQVITDMFYEKEIITCIDDFKTEGLKEKRCLAPDNKTYYNKYESLNNLLKDSIFSYKKPCNYEFYKYEVYRSDLSDLEKFISVDNIFDYMIETDDPNHIRKYLLASNDDRVILISDKYDEDTITVRLYIKSNRSESDLPKVFHFVSC